MSNQYINMCLERSPYVGAAHVVLLVLCNRADKKGYCFPSQDRIAREARIGRETVNKLIKKMKRDGVLVVSKKQPNQYYAESTVKNAYNIRLSQFPALPKLVITSRRNGNSMVSSSHTDGVLRSPMVVSSDHPNPHLIPHEPSVSAVDFLPKAKAFEYPVNEDGVDIVPF